MVLSLRDPLVDPDPIKAALDKFTENFTAFMKIWTPQVIQAMKQTYPKFESETRHNVLICGYAQEDDCLCLVEESMESEFYEKDECGDVIMDCEEEEVNPCTKYVDQTGDEDDDIVVPIVSEVGDSKVFQTEIGDFNPQIHQVFNQLDHSKVNSLSISDFSSPKLLANTIESVFVSNKKIICVGGKVFDKSLERDGYVTMLNPKPPDKCGLSKIGMEVTDICMDMESDHVIYSNGVSHDSIDETASQFNDLDSPENIKGNLVPNILKENIEAKECEVKECTVKDSVEISKAFHIEKSEEQDILSLKCESDLPKEKMKSETRNTEDDCKSSGDLLKPATKSAQVHDYFTFDTTAWFFISMVNPLKKLVSCVIFDLDGTLLNTDGILNGVLKVSLGKYGKQWDGITAHRIVKKMPLEVAATIVEEYEFSISPNYLISEITPMFAGQWSTTKAFPGANRLIKQFRGQGVRMALASNYPRKSIDTNRSYHPGWKESFSVIIGGEIKSDFTYMENVAHVFVCAEEALSSQMVSIYGKVLFITNVEPMKLWDFVTLIFEGLGYQRPMINPLARMIKYIVLAVKWIHSQMNSGKLNHAVGIQNVVQLASCTRTFNCFQYSEVAFHVLIGCHQAYRQKFLTGKRSRMHTTRKYCFWYDAFKIDNMLLDAGFPKRDENVHDAFGACHSSTSISAGLGMAVDSDLLGKKNNVISVIGDGAMTAGQAYEEMNNAGFFDSNMIVILNDNKQVSLSMATLDGPATPVEALSDALRKLQASPKFRKLREAAKSITKQIGPQAHEVAAKVDDYARGMLSATGSTLFEELGLYYIGSVDGLNVEGLIIIFKQVKSMHALGTVLIHIITEKGKGYSSAEAAADKMHGVVKFDPKTGKQSKPKSSTLSYTRYFAEAQIKEAEVDNKIVAIHAAMGRGTGLNYFQKKFPERCFDVGIAEQHVVTFAAGLATEGLKPFSAIYSSFLQQGSDQVVHDVHLQKLPVRFAMDRAGLVGVDGPTHCGAFDIVYMACLPNMVAKHGCFSRSPRNEIFLNSCFAHCPSEKQDAWFLDNPPKQHKRSSFDGLLSPIIRLPSFWCFAKTLSEWYAEVHNQNIQVSYLHFYPP